MKIFKKLRKFEMKRVLNFVVSIEVSFEFQEN